MSVAVLLAVDDRPDNLFVLEQVVEEYLPEIKMITAGSAEAGLALAATEAIDGALIDVQMPGMNGIEMCRRLKSDPRTAPIHVILVTAHGATPELKAQGLEAGADDFITKPIDNVDLAAKVMVMLRLRAAEQALRRERDHLEEMVLERTKALRDAENRYRTLFHAAADAVFINDLEGRLLEVNEQACRLLGYDRDALLHLTVQDFSTPEHVARRPERLEQLRATGHLLFETELVARDGRHIPTECSSRLMELQGQPAVLSIARDITARQEAEQALRTKEQKLQSIFSAAPVGIGMSVNQNILEVNDHICQLTGLSRDELLGKSARLFYPSEQDYQEIRSELYRQLKQTGQATVETRWQRKDGSLFDVSLRSSTLMPGNLDAGVTFSVMDVTERRRAEAEIRLAAEKWQITFDAIGDAVCLIDQDLKISQCNQAMISLAGKPVAEIIGRTCWEALLGSSEAPEDCGCVRMATSRQRESFTMPLGDRWYHATAHPILNETGECTGGVYIIADITDYQRATQKIKDLNVLLKAVKDINEALLRVQTEPDLFRQTCDLLLKVPYVRFVWIGLLQPKNCRIKVVAHAGEEQGHLGTMKISWDESEFGKGPTGEAIRTRKPMVVNDIATDARMAPWRQEVLKRGYHSSISLPLVHQDEVIGILKIYSGELDVFGPEKLEFFTQVAGDIVVGVKGLRLEQDLVQSGIKLEVILLQTIEAIGTIAELRDPYTAGHQRRVTKLALALAAKLGLEKISSPGCGLPVSCMTSVRSPYRLRSLAGRESLARRR